jgi:tRNA threonylcarbamoyl adenosine modification protein (Sua5/YciO/YrdC/YwlC family)
LKDHLPGPYTFILPASKQVPKILQNRKDTIGLRVPNNKIARTIVKELGHPLLSASLEGEVVEDYTDPGIMHENYMNEVDLVVNGGIGGTVSSTVIDCTGDAPVMIREGLGEWKQ